MAHDIEIKMKKYITSEKLVDILSDATYSCSHWCDLYDYDEKDYIEAKEALENFYDREVCFEEVVLEMLEREDNFYLHDSEDDVCYPLTIDKLLNGIKMHIERDFASSNLDDWDGEDSDCVIQYALFNDVVYG